MLFFTPWNWVVTADGMAVTASPGAYAKLAWRGSDADGVLELRLDTSAELDPRYTRKSSRVSPDAKFMTLNLSLVDGKADGVDVLVPPGEKEASIRVLMAELLGDVKSSSTAVHQLTVGVQNSVQSYDRWGDAGGGEGGRPPRLPSGALRLKQVRLPRGAEPEAPQLRPLRLLAFGDSIVEGVGAGYGQGKAGDLHANFGLATFAALLAKQLACECSSVGYGRLGWAVAGNGDVPPFHDVDKAQPSRRVNAASWSHVFAGHPRRFDGEGGSRPLPDIVLINLGTNDGLVATDASAVAHVTNCVHAWLRAARAALGPRPHVVLLVPFGGFGGRTRPPHHVLPDAFARYQRGPEETSSGSGSGGPASEHDPRTHLVDLGAEAALHLDGFRYSKSGRFESTPESADGIHPTRARHAQLAEMLHTAIAPLLAADGEQQHGDGGGQNVVGASQPEPATQ